MDKEKVVPPLPEVFLKRLKLSFPKRWSNIQKAFDTNSNYSVRINPKKITAFEFGLQCHWNDEVYIMEERPKYAADPLFHAGAYYPQEASSTLLEQAFIQAREQIESSNSSEKKSIVVLDLCASPGGKSSHLLSLMNEEDVLIANEIVPKRFQTLKENLSKWGHRNVILTNHAPHKLSRLKGIADIIVIDAPCSGEGLFRKNTKWRTGWTEENCDVCSKRQSTILKDSICLAKENACIIYSTCTLNPNENIHQVQAIEAQGFHSKKITAFEELSIDQIQESDSTAYQCLPDTWPGEPFFIALLQRNAPPEDNIKSKIKFSDLNKLYTPFKGHIEGLKFSNLYQKMDHLYEINAQMQLVIEQFETQRIRYKLMALAEVKKQLILPSHFLAMSLTFDEVKTVELNLKQATQYLKKETFQLSTPKLGWQMVAYKEVILGWVKINQQRVNNKYPVQYRLLK